MHLNSYLRTLLDANIKINIATLKTVKGKDIYVHSKLLLVDDSFFLLGSANINRRSMEIDSEIAICTADYDLASQSRKALWELHSGKDGGKCTVENMNMTFTEWGDQMNKNLDKSDKKKLLDHHLTKFHYDEYSVIRTD